MIVTVEEAKSFLYIEDDGDETSQESILVSSLVEQAQSMAEDFCRVNFDEAETVAPSVKTAILLMVGYLYEHRDSDDRSAWQTTLEAFHRILWPSRDPAQMF